VKRGELDQKVVQLKQSNLMLTLRTWFSVFYGFSSGHVFQHGKEYAMQNEKPCIYVECF